MKTVDDNAETGAPHVRSICGDGPSSSGKSGAPSSVLIVRLGAIGDVLMMLPAVHAMYLGGARVDWVCGRTVAPLLALYPWVNCIVTDERALWLGGRAEQASELLRLWRRLGRRSYDLVATVQYDARYRWLTRWVRTGRRMHLEHGERRDLIEGRSHANEYARVLGLDIDGYRTRNWVPLRPESVPALPELAAVSPGKRGRIGLVPAGARNMLREQALRRWPVENYVALATSLLAGGYEVLLTGAPEDGWVRPAFAGMAVEDWIGRTSLPSLLALYDACDVVVTHDTGSLHMAGISRAAVLALFGPTNPGDFLPRRPGVRALWGGARLPCRPCYDGRDFAPCERNGCMEEISVAAVVDELNRLLRGPHEDFIILPAGQ